MQQNPENRPPQEHIKRLPIAVGFTEDIGHRWAMEDAHVMKLNFGGKPNQAFFAIYDGHCGREVADLAAEKLHGIFLNKLRAGTTPDSALKGAYIETDKLCKDLDSGACALTVFVKDTNLYVANAGDARAVLERGGRAERLSYDHHAEDLAEQKRITAAGGEIVKIGRNYRVMGTTTALIPSRSIGDAEFGDVVTAEPHLRNVTLNEDDSRLIMACDGIWNVMSDQKAVDLIQPLEDPQKASEHLKNEALNRGSSDNLSVIVVDFRS